MNIYIIAFSLRKLPLENFMCVLIPDKYFLYAHVCDIYVYIYVYDIYVTYHIAF